MNAVLVFIGGGLGAVGRFLVSSHFTQPFGTICVNIIGSFLMGLIIGVLSKNSESARLFLTIGFLGGFTTFSSFSMDTLKLVESGRIFLAVGNVVGSVAIGLIVVYLGYSLRRFFV